MQKTGLLLLSSLLILNSCHEIPGSNSATEADFSVKAITPSYLLKKINRFLLPGQGNKLVKEINFARHKHAALLKGLTDADPALLDSILNVPEIQAKRSQDTDFNAFILTLIPQVQGEFKVNTYTTANQYYPDIASYGNGDFVVVWEGTDPVASSYDIFGQRFNSSGVPQGPEFLVNSNRTTGNQTNPSVAVSANGNFVVSWSSNTNLDDSGSGIYARAFAQNGNPLGAEFLVNTETTGDQIDSDIAMDNNGNFIICWSDPNGTLTTGEIYARKFNNPAVPQAAQFRINTTTTGPQLRPEIAMDGTGRYAVIWDGDNLNNGDRDIYAKAFDSSDNVLLPEFRVNDFTISAQLDPDVALNNNGNLVFTWRGVNIPQTNYEVFAKRYNMNGLNPGAEFQVNTFTGSEQLYPAVGIDSSGNFVIAWESMGADGDLQAVAAQRFNSSGVPQGSEFIVNTFTASHQYWPALAFDSNGNFVITWMSYASQDGSYWGVFAKRYRPNGVVR